MSTIEPSSPNPPPPRRRQASRFHLALFSALSLLAAFGFAELIQWTLLPAPHPLRRRPGPAKFTFHTDGKLLPGISGETHFTTESHGLRYSRELAIPRPPDTIRVFCIGGSTTECTYLDDADAWPARCEANLKAVRPNAGVEVINAGFSGMTTADHVAQLDDQIIPLQPTCIVLMVGINDHLRRNSAREGDGRDWRRMAMDYSMTVRRVLPLWRALTGSTGSDGVNLFDANGDTYRRLRAECAATPIATDSAPFDAMPDPLPAFAKNVATIADRCKAEGIQLVLVTHPCIWSEQLGESDLSMLWMRANIKVDGKQPPLTWHIREMNRLNDWLRDFAMQRSISLIDADRLLPKSIDVFYDDCHLNLTGAKLLAERVSQILTLN